MSIDLFFSVSGLRFGVQYSPIVNRAGPYMTRYIVYIGAASLRIHRFYRGDDDRYPHTHPWPFLTIPFAPYYEDLFEKGKYVGTRKVPAFLPNYRNGSFEHIVVCRADEKRGPFWTFVITFGMPKAWGFYTPQGKFIEYTKSVE